MSAGARSPCVRLSFAYREATYRPKRMVGAQSTREVRDRICVESECVRGTSCATTPASWLIYSRRSRSGMSLATGYA